jgi:hypothetical protein
MEIASIKGDTVLLMYHPAEAAADVGQQFTILEVPERTEGLVAQVTSNDSLEYPGLQQEMIQRVLEERVDDLASPIAREGGMQDIKSLKLATAKIRKRVQKGDWIAWDGWIPTRNVEITRVDGSDLLGHVVPEPTHPLRAFTRFDDTAIQFDGTRLNMVSVVTGVKGSGKSHLAKHLLLGLSNAQVPCVVFDINGEYVDLPDAVPLQWGQSFIPKLGELGPGMLRMIVRGLYPFQAGSPSEGVFENQLTNIYNRRKAYCEDRGQEFDIDIPYLRQQTWGGGDFVQAAIASRLAMIQGMNLIWRQGMEEDGVVSSFADVYDAACSGKPVVFDMRQLSSMLQRALVRSIIDSVENVCEEETRQGSGRYPFIFFEEAHFYTTDDAIMNIITRGRHIGMASIFVTNSPQRLPDTVFRQLDNLFLLSLTHRDDIRNVSRNSFTDEDTIESFSTRMPVRHAMVVGNVTDRYPLVLSVDPLPPNVPSTGRTRSTWDRFSEQVEVGL